MSNPLSVRRVKIQTIDERGNPQGNPTFGVMASTNTYQSYNDTFDSLESLNAAIASAITEGGSILSVADGGDLDSLANHRIIGSDNYYGKDWIIDAPNIHIITEEHSSSYTPDAHELDDGGCIYCPDEDGTIRRVDCNGNCEEVRLPAHTNYEEWLTLFKKE